MSKAGKRKTEECPCCGSRVKKGKVIVCENCEGSGYVCPKCDGDECE